MNRAFWEIIESFLKDYREYFERVKRDYKARVKMFQRYLDFEQFKKELNIESFLRDYREFFERL